MMPMVTPENYELAKIEAREAIEEDCAVRLEEHAAVLEECLPGWIERLPYRGAAEHILTITAQMEILKQAASNLRRPKWIRLEQKEW